MSDSIIVRDFDCVCGRLPEVEVIKKRYPGGALALYVVLPMTEEGIRETLLIASCLVLGIPEGCIAVKDFAENRGVLLSLTRAGVIDEPDVYIKGRPICRVLF